MIRDKADDRRATGQHSSSARAPRKASNRPSFEPLEGRLLLSTVPPAPPRITYQDATYTIALAGPGQVHLQKAGRGLVTINLSSTTSASSVTITQTSTTSKYNGSLLGVAGITIQSGHLGQFNGLGTVDLLGTINTTGPVQSIGLGAVGPAARIVASGGLGALDVSGALQLGPKGLIRVAGSLADGLAAGSIDLTGGQIVVNGDAGPIQVAGTTEVNQGGSINIAQDSAGLTFGGNVTVGPGGLIAVGRDLAGAVTVDGNLALDQGQLSIGRDLTGAVTVDGNLAATATGNLTVGRDDTGGLFVEGSVGLTSGGSLDFGRNVGTASVTGLGVGGNLFNGGGQIVVGGNLDGLSVGGVIVGQGTSAVDLIVGLDLDNWIVQGGVADQGGVSRFNVSVAKSIDVMTINHGLFNDFITAGVLITNATVGPDGPVAVFDTQIRAGVQITNSTFSGDVVSDRPTDPLGRLTRIVAGEDRAGNFETGGNMDNVIITGSLIDAVLAASVQPYGGDGSFAVTPTPPPTDGGQGMYNAPLGGIYTSANLGLPYAAPPFDTTTEPVIQDRVLPGSINRSFSNNTGSTVDPNVLPSKSTVDGGVITTAQANGSDYAGIFAADTTGVFVGTLPGKG